MAQIQKGRFAKIDATRLNFVTFDFWIERSISVQPPTSKSVNLISTWSWWTVHYRQDLWARMLPSRVENRWAVFESDPGTSSKSTWVSSISPALDSHEDRKPKHALSQFFCLHMLALVGASLAWLASGHNIRCFLWIHSEMECPWMAPIC